MSKYRTATKNGCPTNWKYAVEKWTIVCKEINVSPLMSAAASFWGTGILVLFIFGGSLGFNSIVNVTPDLARHAFYIVPFIHLAGIFVVQSTIFQVAGTGNPGLTLALWAGGKISSREAISNVLSSTLAWVLFSAIFLIDTPESTMIASIPALQDGIGFGLGLFWEFIASFAWGLPLMFVVGKPDQNLSVGFGLGAGMFIAWHKTRGALNMHRVLGPAIALLFKGNTDYWTTDVFSYILGSPLGFLAAVAVYYFSFHMTVDQCAKSKSKLEPACIPAGPNC